MTDPLDLCLPIDLGLALQVREMPDDFGLEIEDTPDGTRTLRFQPDAGEPIELGYRLIGDDDNLREKLDRLLREAIWLAAEYRRLGVPLETMQ